MPTRTRVLGRKQNAKRIIAGYAGHAIVHGSLSIDDANRMLVASLDEIERRLRGEVYVTKRSHSVQ